MKNLLFTIYSRVVARTLVRSNPKYPSPIFLMLVSRIENFSLSLKGRGEEIKAQKVFQSFNYLHLFTIYYLLFTFIFLNSPCFAMDYADLNSIKEPAYRVGTSDDVEQKSKTVVSVDSESVKELESTINIEKLTYADLSLKKISAQISQDLALESDVMMGDLSMLWQGAATRSDIIKFAIYKLSNPDADKPDEKSVKKVLQTVASMSTLLGAGMGNPVLSSGSFIGGNVLGIMSQDDKAINYKYTKVNDADMIILVRKVDELQQQVVDKYYDYMTSRQMYDMSVKMVKQRHKNYQLSQNSSKEVILITDAYYRDALDMQMKARSEFYSKRASLEQLVGNEVFKKFEADVSLREKEIK